MHASVSSLGTHINHNLAICENLEHNCKDCIRCEAKKGGETLEERVTQLEAERQGGTEADRQKM